MAGEPHECDDWQQIEAIVDSALKKEPAERASFLEKACPSEKLRREITARLAQESTRIVEPGMTRALTAGTKLGPYQIEKRIGAGGMGEVFRALDTRLGRPVAIKASKTAFSEHFEREARVIASLNHPNICTLYDVGPDYLVMELCEGETLASRIQKGRLPVAECLKIGSQIAAALAAAHARSIVHRDLKPGNIILTRTGPKVLDFGLAKSSMHETVAASGVVMGTPAYMAPEQRQGQLCDARTDIYALGLILCEMTTGKPYPDSVTDAASFPGQVITKCLEAIPDDRWQSAADIAAILEWKQAPVPTPSPVSRVKWISALALTVLAVFTIALLAWRLSVRAPGEPIRFTEAPNGQVDTANTFAVSPDGRFFATSLQRSSGARQIWVRPINESQGRWLDRTEGADTVFWSADSRWIGFFAGGRIRRIQPGGGPVESVAEVPGLYCATWNAAGDIIFAPFNRSPLYRIRSAGGGTEAITKLDGTRKENSHRWPQFLPDGRHYLFTARSTEARNNAVYFGSLDSSPAALLTYVESQVLPIPGALLFVREQTLFRQPFNGERLTGPAVALRGGVAQSPISAVAGFSASAEGDVMVIHPASSSGSQLSWFTRRGDPAGTVGPEGTYYAPRISPDGTHAIVDRPDGDRGNRDLWSIDLRSGTMMRLTTNPANDMTGIWMPDNREIVFSSDRSGGTDMEFFRKSALTPDGEAKVPLNRPAGQVDMTDVSSDGRWGALSGHAPPNTSVLLVRLNGSSPPVEFSKSAGLEHLPRFSPKGNWLSYTSSVSGHSEVFAGRFNQESGMLEGSAIQVSREGGNFSSWSRDGSELFFLSPDMQIFAVPANQLQAGSPVPVPLFRICPGTNPLSGGYTGYPYAPSPNGRFLCICTGTQNSLFEFSVTPRSVR